MSSQMLHKACSNMSHSVTDRAGVVQKEIPHCHLVDTGNTTPTNGKDRLPNVYIQHKQSRGAVIFSNG